MNDPTLLIVAHGSRRSASNEEVRALAERLAARPDSPFARVRVAFLELAAPSIPEALAACANEGSREIVVFPYFLAAGTHVARDIPEILDAFQHAHPEVKLRLTPHLGAAASLPRAILEVAA